MHQRVLVVSIDGVAPRYVTPQTMPHLCALALDGTSSFSASTVYPSITLPAHASLLRGVDPSVHGIFDNTPLPLSVEWPSFLKVAKDAGFSTAALLNWIPVNGLVEDDALDVRYFLNGGYGNDDDAMIATAAKTVLADQPDVAFAYLVSPDLAGHDFGWGSDDYLAALGRSDAALGSLLVSAGSDCAVIVTTDHGGHGNDHQQSKPLDMETFITIRATGIAPCTTLSSASILDVAPTVAAVVGMDAPEVWSGRSLLGHEQPIVDHLLDLVGSMADQHYGEHVNMLEHSLQTAALARQAGESDDMVIAALLHDVGHVLGKAGEWGLPDHAQVAARSLQALFPASVVEPIRLHVDAKRYLVRDASYAAALSRASTESLAEQGGPFTEQESRVFLDADWSGEAIRLRLLDDAGKAPEMSPGATAYDRAAYGELIERVLRQETEAVSLRDRCQCAACRDPQTGQSLLDVGDLDGWTVRGRSHGDVHLSRSDGEQHVVTLSENHGMSPAPRNDFVAVLKSAGLACASGAGTDPATVLTFARRLGFVRETNYGDLFDVMAKPDANNLAYTAMGLPLHTDNPYRDPVPTVQVLHCLQPARSGGASRFSDGFAAAERLRTADRSAFDILTNTLLTFEFRDVDVHLVAQRPMIELDVDGDVVAVAVNHRSMVPPALGVATGRFYAAYAQFVDQLDDGATEVMLEAGDVVAFDNRRMLHARASFDASDGRHLQGCYVDLHS